MGRLCVAAGLCLACFLALPAEASAQSRSPVPQASDAELVGPGEAIEGQVYDQERPGRYAEPQSPPFDYWQPTWMPCQSLRTNRSLVLGHLWFGMDIMAWSTKGVHAPALLTTSPVGTDVDDAGIIGAGGTRVLFGDEIIHNETRPGGRLRIGWYFDPNQYSGLEWHYFNLDGQDIHYDAIAANGSGVLARPIVDAGSGDNGAVLVAFPALVDGEINFLSNLQLTSTGIVYHNLFWATPFARADYLIGYRHARLYENLRVDESLEYLDDEGGFVSGDEVTRRDQFRAINQFDGLDLGLRGWWSRNGKLAITGLAKIAVGASNKNVIIDGFTTINDDTFGRGVLALPSNRGGRAEQEFGVVSELGLGLEWQPMCQVRLSLGYSWFYWSDVARAINQIDTTINTDQLAPTNGPGGRPVFDMQTTSFWAQGLNAGFVYEF